MEGFKEALIRCKRLYVMNDIFNLFSGTDNDRVADLKSKYLEYGTFKIDIISVDWFVINSFRFHYLYVNLITGELPDLQTLKVLREKAFKGELDNFKIPEFEDVAAEL